MNIQTEVKRQLEEWCKLSGVRLGQVVFAENNSHIGAFVTSDNKIISEHYYLYLAYADFMGNVRMQQIHRYEKSPRSINGISFEKHSSYAGVTNIIVRAGIDSHTVLAATTDLCAGD